MKPIHIRVTTFSNLFIGASPSSFEIGGIDLYTVRDYMGNPFIPASSFKGPVRRVVREMPFDDLKEKIKNAYRAYLLRQKEKNLEQIQKYAEKIERERIDKMLQRFDESIEKASAEYLFGIPGFNDSPKLIFHDLVLEEKFSNAPLFSIDTKNSISYSDDNRVVSNPRTYQTVRPGISFSGQIQGYRLDELKEDSIRELIGKSLLEFNNGVYRLGNSGSRGYGRIRIEIL